MQAAVSVAAPLPAIVNLQNGSIFELSSSGNGGSSSTSSLEPQLSSSIALVMALVLSIVFVVGYLTLFLRQWVSVGAGVGLGGNSRSQFRGVDPDLIGRFPLFQYPGNSSSGRASCSKGATECMVCLSDFEEGEVLLILPACHHAFHRPCIDLWLFSHRTCPLCRSSVILLPPKKAALDRDCSYGRTSIALEMPAMVERVFARAPAAAAAEAIERRNPSWEFPSGSLMEDKAKEAIDGKNTIKGFPFSAVKEEEAMEGRNPNRGSFQFSTPAEEEEAIDGRSPNRSFPLMEAVSQLRKSHSTGHPFLPSELQYEVSRADKSQNAHSISILSSPSSSEKKEETMEGGNPNQGFLLTEISSKLWRSHSTGHPFPPSELQYQVSMADKSHNVHSISIFRSSSSSSEAMEGRNPNQGFPSTEIPSQLWKSHSTGHPFLPSDEVSMAGKS